MLASNVCQLVHPQRQGGFAGTWNSRIVIGQSASDSLPIAGSGEDALPIFSIRLLSSFLVSHGANRQSHGGQDHRLQAE